MRRRFTFTKKLAISLACLFLVVSVCFAVPRYFNWLDAPSPKIDKVSCHGFHLGGSQRAYQDKIKQESKRWKNGQEFFETSIPNLHLGFRKNRCVYLFFSEELELFCEGKTRTFSGQSRLRDLEKVLGRPDSISDSGRDKERRYEIAHLNLAIIVSTREIPTFQLFGLGLWMNERVDAFILKSLN